MTTETKVQHTYVDGPWKYRRNPEPDGKWDWWVDTHDGTPIASVFDYDNPRAAKHERLLGQANARLIAASPELLEALEDAFTVIGEGFIDGESSPAAWPQLAAAQERIRQAIALAKGVQDAN